MNRVLIVDDDPAIRQLLSKIVSRCGWEALPASSGLEALQVADRADVVVTDLAMPGMDGMELLRALRQRDATLPVILVTGHYWEGLAEAAVAAGAFDCLPKPFELRALTLTIENALQAPRRERAERPTALAV